MKLPDPVLAFKLLDGSNINDDERKLPLALGMDMKYEDMKSALKSLFNKSAATTTQPAIIKQEETFCSKAKNKSPKYLSSNNKTKTIKHNPLNKHGEISRCVVCDSNMHWPDKWPHKSETGSAYLVERNDSGDDDDDDDNLEEINTVLITEEDDKSEVFVAEASKSAVIDTTCTKTVADEKWFKNYTSIWQKKQEKKQLVHQIHHLSLVMVEKYKH